jgi:hypothetical protein
MILVMTASGPCPASTRAAARKFACAKLSAAANC